MLGPIGMQELVIIFVIALIVFGPRKLPEIGKSLGRSIGEFKRASNELRSTLEQEIRVEETRKEIMEPIETISQEAKQAVEKATELPTTAEEPDARENLDEPDKPDNHDGSHKYDETDTDSSEAQEPHESKV